MMLTLLHQDLEPDLGDWGYGSICLDTGKCVCAEGRGWVHLNQVSFNGCVSIPSNSVLTGRLRSKAGEMIQGEVLKKAEETAEKKDSIQFVVTEELEEAISGDIISEVEMDREMRLSKRIVDEILSIYM